MTTRFLFPIFNCLALASIIGCANTQPISLPKDYSITLWERAGMIPNETKIVLSNSEACRIAFNNDGVKNKLVFTPKEEELESIVHAIQSQNFSSIKSSTSETYDRGGSEITTLFDGKKVSISNMESSYIQKNGQIIYKTIYDSIFELAKKYVNEQLVAVQIDIDNSLMNPSWKTGIQINRGNYFEESYNTAENNSQQSRSVKLIPGKNHISIYTLDKSNRKQLFDGSKTVSILPDTKKITLAKKGSGVEVIYNNQKQKDRTVKKDNHSVIEYGIIEQQDLNQFITSNFLDIHLNIDQEDPAFKEFNLKINYKDKTGGKFLNLIQTYGSLVDTYGPITYSLIHTAFPNAPYLLYYSGQAGDEYNVDGKIILFNHSEIISTLDLNGGNRIPSKLMEYSNGIIQIHEAFMCHQGIVSQIEIRENEVFRQTGIFPVKTIYPILNNTDLSEYEQTNVYELKSDLKISLADSSKTYSAGEKIIIRLLRVDYINQRIFLEINDKEAFMPIEDFKAHEFPQSMYGAKCEMG